MRIPRAILTVVATGHLAACGGQGSPAAPSGVAETFADPAGHRAPLPGGGEITLQFVGFHPARGARLENGRGAYVTARYELPRRPMLVSAAGDAWSGSAPLSASFMSTNILFALPVCADGAPVLTRTDQFGRAAHPQFEFPRPGDPDVPYLRIRIWVTDWPHGCESPLPRPDIAAIQLMPPTLTAIERVAWRKP